MEIIVHTAEPRRVTPKELKELAETIRSSYLGVSARAEWHERAGRGIALHEVVSISIKGAEALGATALAAMGKRIGEIAVDWARKRYARLHKSSTVSIPIYGPDGKVIKTVRVRRGKEEPEDRKP